MSFSHPASSGNRHLRQLARRAKGFTLLEVLLVMAILIILMSLVGAGYFAYFASSKEDAAKMQAVNIQKNLQSFLFRTGATPTSLDDLIRAPSGMSDKKWKGPYLEGNTVPLDPWNNKFEMIIQGEGRKMRIYVKSRGADGQDGTEDDIIVPEDNANQNT